MGAWIQQMNGDGLCEVMLAIQGRQTGTNKYKPKAYENPLDRDLQSISLECHQATSKRLKTSQR